MDINATSTASVHIALLECGCLTWHLLPTPTREYCLTTHESSPVVQLFALRAWRPGLATIAILDCYHPTLTTQTAAYCAQCRESRQVALRWTAETCVCTTSH